MQAPSFDEAQVIDAMHPGVLTCPPATSIRTAARMMATYRVHAIVVTAADPDDDAAGRPWAVLSDLDVAKAAAQGHADATAGGMAQTELLTVAPGESLRRAAQLLSEHGISHLVVVDGDDPVGVLSTQDVAACIAMHPPPS